MSTVERKLNVLITGGSGWLGQFVHKKLFDYNNQHDAGFSLNIHVTYNSKFPEWLEPSKSHKVDFSKECDIPKCLESFPPDIVIHLAAISSPVACERDPELASRVNRPVGLIDTIKAVNPECLFVFTSTDLVYDGEHPPYDVVDRPSSRTVYGQTKAAFEDDVLTLKFGLVLRLSNMIGPKYCYQKVGGKFLQWLEETRTSKEYVGLFYDQMRSFVSVYDVVEIVSKAVRAYATGSFVFPNGERMSLYGIFNVGGPEGCSRLTLAEYLSRATNTELIVHESKDDDNDESGQKGNIWKVYKSSNRGTFICPGVENPRDVTMINLKTEQNFQILFSPIQEVIASFL